MQCKSAEVVQSEDLPVPRAAVLFSENKQSRAGEHRLISAVLTVFCRKELRYDISCLFHHLLHKCLVLIRKIFENKIWKFTEYIIIVKKKALELLMCDN